MVLCVCGTGCGWRTGVWAGGPGGGVGGLGVGLEDWGLDWGPGGHWRGTEQRLRWKSSSSSVVFCSLYCGVCSISGIWS